MGAARLSSGRAGRHTGCARKPRLQPPLAASGGPPAAGALWLRDPRPVPVRLRGAEADGAPLRERRPDTSV
eukprot:4111582-Alexandrium_andersonii.AAC.1